MEQSLMSGVLLAPQPDGKLVLLPMTQPRLLQSPEREIGTKAFFKRPKPQLPTLLTAHNLAALLDVPPLETITPFLRLGYLTPFLPAA
jgi:hypothetical protein